MADIIAKVLLTALSVSLSAAIINSPNIHRPCPIGKNADIACVQSSLQSKSRCAPTRGIVPPLHTVPSARFDAPAFNASYVDQNLRIKGLDRCFVSEYYWNRQTNRGVLAIDCPWLTIESNRIMYQHYPRAEDGIFHYFISGNYPLITFTVQLSNFNQVNICQEYSNAHVHALPTFNLSPQDRPTKNHLTLDLSALNTYERETFAARTQLISRLFINTKLCNFGC